MHNIERINAAIAALSALTIADIASPADQASCTDALYQLTNRAEFLRSQTAAKFELINPPELKPTQDELSIARTPSSLHEPSNKLKAIKLMRERTGCGLAEAKRAIEAELT